MSSAFSHECHCKIYKSYKLLNKIELQALKNKKMSDVGQTVIFPILSDRFIISNLSILV